MLHAFAAFLKGVERNEPELMTMDVLGRGETELAKREKRERLERNEPEFLTMHVGREETRVSQLSFFFVEEKKQKE